MQLKRLMIEQLQKHSRKGIELNHAFQEKICHMDFINSWHVKAFGLETIRQPHPQ